MEKSYIENKILKELINNNHENWNKESIDLLLYIFEFEFLSNMHNLGLILLKDYILWYKNNLSLKCSESDFDMNLYKLEDLENIYSKIDNNLLENKYENYIKILKKSNKNNLENNINIDEGNLGNINLQNNNSSIKSLTNTKKEDNLYYNTSNYCKCPVFYLEDFIFDNFIWICLAIFFFIYIFFGKSRDFKNYVPSSPLLEPRNLSSISSISPSCNISELFGKISENFNLDESLQKFISSLNH